ncbi:hypothetical protein SDC9_208993 [bioreactor metagenome]|uniref:Uncharacterized protein n=1 Tax=bioreactor metagenome TaxID=1076179 RepID=A0A645JC43_9ZZZZ
MRLIVARNEVGMKLNKFGRFVDPYRGNGWFVSWTWVRGYFLVALRPMNWRLDYLRLPNNRWVRRLYVGPIEFEITDLGRS